MLDSSSESKGDHNYEDHIHFCPIDASEIKTAATNGQSANQESLNLNLWEIPFRPRNPTPQNQEYAGVKPSGIQILSSWMDRNVLKQTKPIRCI